MSVIALRSIPAFVRLSPTKAGMKRSVMTEHLSPRRHKKRHFIFWRKPKHTNSAEALWELTQAHDTMGDNEHSKGLHDKAHEHRLRALELFEQYVKLDPSAQKYASYFRGKVDMAPQ